MKKLTSKTSELAQEWTSPWDRCLRIKVRGSLLHRFLLNLPDRGSLNTQTRTLRTKTYRRRIAPGQKPKKQMSRGLKQWQPLSLQGRLLLLSNNSCSSSSSSSSRGLASSNRRASILILWTATPRIFSSISRSTSRSPTLRSTSPTAT